MNTEKKNTSYPIRMGESLDTAINEAAERLDTSKQDAIRFLIRIGLTHLEKINYNVPRSVLRDSGVNIKEVPEKK